MVADRYGREEIRTALAAATTKCWPEGTAERRAAVTLLLAPDPTDPERVEALFVLRAQVDGDPWSGHVALPGGREEAGDEDLLDTARRELAEETTIELPRDAYLGTLDELAPRAVHLPSISVCPFVAWSDEQPPVRENRELAGHLWIPLGELAAPDRRSSIERGGPAPRSFETIEYAGATVWGMTLAIVDDFLERIGLR